MKYKYIRECVNRVCFRTTNTPCYSNECGQYQPASFKECIAECITEDCSITTNFPCYDSKCPTYQEAVSLKIELG